MADDKNTTEGKKKKKSKFDETTENIKDEAKSTAKEFKEGWNEATKSGENKKLMAGILGIILGAFGVHKFILGYNKEGIILLVLTLIGIVTSCFVFGAFIFESYIWM